MIPSGGIPPFVKDILARGGAPNISVRQRFGVKVSETGQSFHRLKLKDWAQRLKRKSKKSTGHAIAVSNHEQFKPSTIA
jgi:hypothetical protein